MRDSWNRRDVMRTFGVGLIGAATPHWVPPLSRTRRRDDTIDGLAERIIRTPRAKVFELLQPRLKDGLPWETLQAAICVAGLRETEPRPVGNKFHAVLAVESVYQLAATGPASERGMAVLWNLEEIKIAQERDEWQGGWTLPPAQEVRSGSRMLAEQDISDGFRDNDEQRTDRGATALARTLGLLTKNELFEIFWHHGMYEHVGLCHRMIFAVHAARLAARLPDEYTETLARSLVHGLFERRAVVRGEEYEASCVAARALPESWTRGEHDPDRSLAIARALRGLDPTGARALAVSELAAGRAPRTLWDGLRLAAADAFSRKPDLLVVHATTVTNCLFHVFRVARNDYVRRVALLQAFAWMPLFRDRFVSSRDMDMSLPGLDAVLVRSDGPSEAEVETALRANLFRNIDQNHQVKYAAAMLEDVQFVDSRWRRALLLPALPYLSDGQTERSELSARSRELLARTGR